MSIKAFIEQQLTGVSLEPPVFYNAEAGIRFEAGPSDPSIEDQGFSIMIVSKLTGSLEKFEASEGSHAGS